MAAPFHFQQFEVEVDPAGTPVELGRGGMGVTYKAFDTRLRRPVVLKVIRDGLLNDDTASRRFLREARSAARIQHPNIATVFDQGQQGDTFFYAMEFIEGETLQSLIKRVEKLDSATALEIILQVTKALQAAWAEKVIHRDIKPANIMLVKDKLGGDDLLVKLIDFGLAKAAVSKAGGGSEVGDTVTTVNDGGLTAGFVGTPHFASPEQIEPTVELDIRSDIYSLGVTLWYALRGSPPFGGTSFVRVAAQHLSKPPPFEELQDAPEAVIKLLGRMLAKDRDDRPADPTELRREIEAALRAVKGSEHSGLTSVPAVGVGAPPKAPMTWPPQVGSVLLGRFELLEQVSEDPTGRLFRAHDRQHSNTTIGVRILRSGLLNTPESRQQFQKSADAIAALRNPAIVSDVALYETEGGRFITLEWLESRSLMDVLRARGAALPAAEVQSVVDGLVGAADAAAGAGLESLDLSLGQVAMHLPDGLPHEGWDMLLSRPLAHWPRWQIKVNAMDLAEKGAPPPMPDAEMGMMTILPGATSARDALKPLSHRYTERIAALAYELLGGAPNRLDPSRLALSGYTSISAVAEEGNQVLRRALRPAPGEAFATSRDFAGALAVALPRRASSATTSRPGPSATSVPPPPHPPTPPAQGRAAAPSPAAVPSFHAPTPPTQVVVPAAQATADSKIPLIVAGVAGGAAILLAISIFAFRKSGSSTAATTNPTPAPQPTGIVAQPTPGPVATQPPLTRDTDPAVAGMPEPAVVAFKNARKTESNPARAWLVVGDDFRRAARPVEAARAFERAVQLDTSLAEGYDRLAYTSLLLARFQDSEQAARKATILNPNLPGPWRTLGINQYLTLQFDDARQSYQRAISAAERAPQSAANFVVHGDALVNLARIQAPNDAKSSVARAIDVMNQAVSAYPKEPEVWQYLGDAFGEGGQIDRAVDAFQKALTLRPDFVEAMSDLGFNYTNAKQYSRAIDTLTRATKINADYPIVWNNLGSAYVASKQFPEAINAYRRATALSPDFAFSLDGLGESYLRNNQPRLALEPLQRAAQVLPGLPSAWKNLSDAHRRLEEYPKAIEEAQRAVKLGPYYADGYDMLGAAYTASGSPEKGISAYEKAVELNPESTSAWNRLGVAYWRTKQYDKAMDAYRRAVKVDPENYEAWDNIGDAYKNKGQNQLAVESYQKAVKINPNYAVGWNDLGYVLNDLNQDSAAMDAYQRAVAIDENYATAWSNIGYTWIKTGPIERAIEPLQRALKLNPQYPIAWNNLAFAYNKLGRVDEAIEAYKKAVTIKPDYTTAWNDLAAIYEKRGQTALAREARQRGAGGGGNRPANTTPGQTKPKGNKDFEDMLRNLEQMQQKVR